MWWGGGKKNLYKLLLQVHDHISRHNPWDQSVFDAMNLQVMTNEEAENQYENNGDLGEIEDLEVIKIIKL